MTYRKRDADSVGDYLSDIGRFPLLTADEEIMLGRKVKEYMNLVQDSPDGEDTKWKGKERLIARSGKRAIERFYTGNLRLVTTLAKKFVSRTNHLSFLDLCQEGNIGLLSAIKKFDHERGYKFSTYAYWWIRQSISRAINSHDRMIRMPIMFNDFRAKVSRFVTEYARDHMGTTPSYKEIAKHCNCSVEQVETYAQWSYDASSINVLFNDEQTELVNCIPCPKSTGDQLDEIGSQMDHDSTEELLLRLQPRQVEVITKVYGLRGKEPMTLSAIGTEMGCSRERVRQIKETSLRQMRLMTQQLNALAHSKPAAVPTQEPIKRHWVAVPTQKQARRGSPRRKSLTAWSNDPNDGDPTALNEAQFTNRLRSRIAA